MSFYTSEGIFNNFFDIMSRPEESDLFFIPRTLHRITNIAPKNDFSGKFSTIAEVEDGDDVWVHGLLVHLIEILLRNYLLRSFLFLTVAQSQ